MTAEPESLSPVALREWPLPEPGGHKKSRGRVLVIGGARTAPGAALLAGRAALRAGAGVLTVALAESVAAAVGAVLPEAGLIWLAEPIGADAVARVADTADTADAILIGPGLDDLASTKQLLVEMVPKLGPKTPVLCDAYALGALKDIDDEVIRALSGRLVLTPNPDEADLLAPGIDDLATRTRQVADRFSAVVTCQNLIVNPAGRSWQVPAGHSGLGTSGSGDVLAGIIVGLLARGAELDQATAWGTFLHANAAERLSASMGPLGFLAGELLDPLPMLLAELQSRLT